MRVSSGELDVAGFVAVMVFAISGVSFARASGAAFLSASLLRSCSRSLQRVVKISTVSLRSFFSVASKVIFSLHASRSTLRFSFSKASGSKARVCFDFGLVLGGAFGGARTEFVVGAADVKGALNRGRGGDVEGMDEIKVAVEVGSGNVAEEDMGRLKLGIAELAEKGSRVGSDDTEGNGGGNVNKGEEGEPHVNVVDGDTIGASEIRTTGSGGKYGDAWILSRTGMESPPTTRGPDVCRASDIGGLGSDLGEDEPIASVLLGGQYSISEPS